MSILQEDLIKKLLPGIIKNLSVFAIANKTQLNIEILLVGELYTLIRRHLPHLCLTNINFTKYNIEKIYINYSTGEILWVNFIKDHRFRGCYKEEVIDCLNKILEEINPNYSILNLSCQLNSITQNLENYKPFSA